MLLSDFGYSSRTGVQVELQRKALKDASLQGALQVRPVDPGVGPQGALGAVESAERGGF